MKKNISKLLVILFFENLDKCEVYRRVGTTPNMLLA